MGIEEYNQALPEEKKEKEVTVKDVLADKKQSALFGEFINSKPDKAGEPTGSEIAERLLKGESTPEDLKVLTEQKDNFLKQQKEVQRISKALTPDLLKRLASQSSTMETLIKAGGIEGVRGAVVSQLEMIAMREPKRFSGMVEAYDHLIERTNAINIEIEQLCKDNNIGTDEYLKILENPDVGERQQALYDRMKKQMGFYKGRLREGKYTKEMALKASVLNNKDDIDNMKKEYDSELEVVGRLLAASINENKDINKAFMNVLLGEQMPKKEEMSGFKEMRGTMPSAEDLRKQWEEEKAKGTTKDDFQINYLNSYRRKVRDGGGKFMENIINITKGLINDFS